MSKAWLSIGKLLQFRLLKLTFAVFLKRNTAAKICLPTKVADPKIAMYISSVLSLTRSNKLQRNNNKKNKYQGKNAYISVKKEIIQKLYLPYATQKLLALDTLFFYIDPVFNKKLCKIPMDKTI